ETAIFSQIPLEMAGYYPSSRGGTGHSSIEPSVLKCAEQQTITELRFELSHTRYRGISTPISLSHFLQGSPKFPWPSSREIAPYTVPPRRKQKAWPYLYHFLPGTSRYQPQVLN